MPRNPNDAVQVPAVVTGFGSTSIATLDLNRFRNALNTVEQTIETGGGKNFLRMNRAGVWVYGSESTEIEEGAEMAVNPLGLEMGYVAWSGQGGGRPLGQVMRSILQPPVQQSELPHVAAEWTQCVGVQFRCMNGEDEGMNFEYTTNSYGGRSAFEELAALIKAQLDLDPSRLIPVVAMESESYRHPQWGQIFNPIFRVIRWVGEEDVVAPADTDDAPAAAQPAPAAAAPPPPAPAAAAAPEAPTRRGRGRPAAAPAATAPAVAAPAATTGTRSRRRAA